MSELTEQQRKQERLKFLHLLFSPKQGFICLATLPRHQENSVFKQFFFEWPRERYLVNGLVEGWLSQEGLEIYLCPHLLSKPERKKEFALPSPVVWADLDKCPYSALGEFGEALPNLLVRSSEYNYQAYWILKQDLQSIVYENLNRCIYEAYKKHGCDRCWALTHLLRMPLTYNWKREEPWLITYRAMHSKVGKFSPIHIKELLQNLPTLELKQARSEEINYDDSRGLPLGMMSSKQQNRWNELMGVGDRARRVFMLVAFMKRELKSGDGRIIKVLMEHPVAVDKWPDRKKRQEDIERCLLKVKTT